MFIKKLLFCFVVLYSTLISAQNKVELSPLSKVSLLTIGPQEELSSKFGHSAFRIQDPTLGIDVTYNYGMFDFSDPYFYFKFTTGKLPYKIGRHSFDNFIYTYKIENKWVKEQHLALNLKEKNNLIAFLENNLLPENKYYKYDFLFDNCATKIPEVLNKVTQNNLLYSYPHLKKKKTFRDLIHEFLVLNEWATFGIDLALGSVIDKKASSLEHQFLPIYVYHQLEHTTKKDGTPLVSKTAMILKSKAEEKNNLFILSPIFWLGIILIATSSITIKDYSSKKRTKWLDIFLFTATGLAGIVILFLWFGTDHTATAWNFNFLWAFPVNLYFAFLVRKNKLPENIKLYVIILLSLILVTMFLWVAKIQVFSPILIFILLSLIIRYLYILFYLRHSHT